MKKYLKIIVFVVVVLLVMGVLYWRQRDNALLIDGVERVDIQLVDRGNYGLYSGMISDEIKDEEYGQLTAWVIEDSASWKRFWESNIRDDDTGGFEGAPTVDFDTKLAIGVLQGIKEAGGYYLTVNEVKISKNAVVIYAQIIEPRGDEVLSQVVTSPYDVFTIDRNDVFSNDSARLIVINTVDGETVFDKSIKEAKI
ncbi:protease complex subunit PrcB family protein [Patescibacteria group bacterium]|nr:protease complex subunit PrcB family protein [Patescibacteria group bacterium]